MNDKLDDVTEVAVFLVFMESHDPRAMWGSRRIKDAVDAFARIIGTDPKVLRERLLRASDVDDN